jgi:hypothetical protein
VQLTLFNTHRSAASKAKQTKSNQSLCYKHSVPIQCTKSNTLNW